MLLYREVKINSDGFSDGSVDHTMEVLFSRLHGYLANKALQNVGVSFPQYCATGLGNVVRLHSTDPQLLNLEWLTGGGIRRMVEVTETTMSPENTKYVRVVRFQPKNLQRIRRRQIRRHGTSSIPESGAKTTTELPFVWLDSSSTQRKYPLYIRQEEVLSPTPGTYTSFGLSCQGSTVPLF